MAYGLPEGFRLIDEDQEEQRPDSLPDGFRLLDEPESNSYGLPPGFRIVSDQPEEKGATFAGTAKALGRGVAEGLTTGLPELGGEALEFVGGQLNRPVKAILGETAGEYSPFRLMERGGEAVKEWSQKKARDWFGEAPEDQPWLEKVVYEGSKMLAPSIIPGGVATAGARALKGLSGITKGMKTARAAGDVAKYKELKTMADTVAKSATNWGAGSAGVMFGLSQAQSTIDAANQRADQLEAIGDFGGAKEARATGEGIAPYLTGAIEAVGEFFGTKYLGKLFRLDEAEVVKRGAKNLAKDFLKTLGVEVSTEMGQAAGETGIEKAFGVRPDADVLRETLDVIGPTAFMTLLTGGLAAGANLARKKEPYTPKVTDPKEIVARIREDVASGAVSNEELISYRKDPNVAELGLTDEINKIIIEQKSAQLDSPGSIQEEGDRIAEEAREEEGRQAFMSSPQTEEVPDALQAQTTPEIKQPLPFAPDVRYDGPYEGDNGEILGHSVTIIDGPAKGFSLTVNDLNPETIAQAVEVKRGEVAQDAEQRATPPITSAPMPGAAKGGEVVDLQQVRGIKDASQKIDELKSKAVAPDIESLEKGKREIRKELMRGKFPKVDAEAIGDFDIAGYGKKAQENPEFAKAEIQRLESEITELEKAPESYPGSRKAFIETKRDLIETLRKNVEVAQGEVKPLLSTLQTLRRSPREVVPIPKLRKESGLSPEEFDRQMTELAKSGQVALHAHDNAYALSEEERAGLFSEESATARHGRQYYAGVVEKGKPAVPKGEKTEPIIEGEGYSVREVAGKEGRIYTIDLNQDAKDALGYAQEFTQIGEPGRRIFTEKGPGEGGGSDVIGFGSTYPDFFRGKGWASKDVLQAVNKALEGKELGKRQIDMVTDALEWGRDTMLEEKKASLINGGIERDEVERVQRDGEKEGVQKANEDFAGEVARDSGLSKEEINELIVKAEKEAPWLFEPEEKSFLTPSEPTPQEQIQARRERGEITSPEKGEKPKNAFPDEKIKAPTTGKQRGMFGEETKKGESKDLFDETRLSLAPETPKSLVIAHNLSISNLRHAIKMGGLAVPSTAVIDVNKSSYTNFGEVTLIAHPNRLGPEAEKTNKYFNADVYSPRYPKITYFLTDKSRKKLNDWLDPIWRSIPKAKDDRAGISSHWTLEERIKDEGIDQTLKEEHGLLYYAFLKETGKLPGGINTSWDSRTKLRKLVEKIGKDKYEAWADKKIQELGLEADEKIFNGFTYTGNRRYLKHNLDTVVKLLKKELRDGEGFNYGVPSIRAKNAMQFRTIKRIQQHRDKIVSKEEMEPLKEEVNAEFTKLYEKTAPFLKGKRGFGDMDAFSEHIKEAIETRRFNGVFGEKSEYYEPGVDVNAVIDFVNKLHNMPTEYFEGKIQRSVGLTEFEAAIVPDDTPKDLIDWFSSRNIAVETYKRGDDADRKAKVRDAATKTDTMFSLSLSPLEARDLGQVASDINRWLSRILPKDVLMRTSLELRPLWKLKDLDLSKAKRSLEEHGVKAEGDRAVLGATEVNDLTALIKMSYHFGDDVLERTAYHEGFHVVSRLLLPDADYKTLIDHFGNEEAAAKAFGTWAQGKARKPAPTAIEKIFRFLRRVFNQIRGRLRLQGHKTPEAVFEKIWGKEYKTRMQPSSDSATMASMTEKGEGRNIPATPKEAEGRKTKGDLNDRTEVHLSERMRLPKSRHRTGALQQPLSDSQSIPRSVAGVSSEDTSLSGGARSEAKQLAPPESLKDKFIRLRTERKAREAEAERIADESNGQPIVLTDQTGDRGVLIIRSTKIPGKFQVTHWDDKGFSGDFTEDTLGKAVNEAMGMGYETLNPGAFERISRTRKFQKWPQYFEYFQRGWERGEKGEGVIQLGPPKPEFKTTFNEAKTGDDFKISLPDGSYANGYFRNADIGTKPPDPTRAELFFVGVNEKRKGNGMALAKEALSLMKSKGADTVVMFRTTDEGRDFTKAMEGKGLISGPIFTTQLGKTEHRILSPNPTRPPESGGQISLAVLHQDALFNDPQPGKKSLEDRYYKSTKKAEKDPTDLEAIKESFKTSSVKTFTQRYLKGTSLDHEKFLKETGITLTHRDFEDLNKYFRKIQTSTDIAEKHEAARNLLEVQVNRQGRTNQMAIELRKMSEDYFGKLSPEEMDGTDLALAYGDRIGKYLKVETLKNKFKLNEKQIKAYFSMRKTMDYVMDFILEQKMNDAFGNKRFEYSKDEQGPLSASQIIHAIKNRNNTLSRKHEGTQVEVKAKANETLRGKLVEMGLKIQEIDFILQENGLADWTFARRAYMPHAWKTEWRAKVTTKDGREFMIEVPGTFGSKLKLTKEGRRKAAEKQAIREAAEKLGGENISTVHLIHHTELPVDLYEGTALATAQGVIESATENIMSEFEGDLTEQEKEKLGTIKENVQKSLQQLYLAKGWGRHLLSRKGIEGYRIDFRNVVPEYLYGFSAYHNKMIAAREFAKHFKEINAGKTPQLWAWSKEYISDMLGDSSEAGVFKRIVGFYFLAGDLSAAALNMTQNWTHAVGVLRGIQVKGGPTAEREIATAMKDVTGMWIEARGMTLPEKSKHVSPEELTAMKVALEKGLLDPQFFGEVTGLHTNKWYMNGVDKAQEVMYKGFIGAEAMNRMSTFIAAFRRANRAGVEDPVGTASKVVIDSHFLYGKGNRPELIRKMGMLGNVAYTFGTYPLNNIFFLKQRALDILKAETPQARKTAMKVLGSNLAYVFAFGGLNALPFMFLGKLIYAIFTDPEDDWEVLAHKYAPQWAARGVVRGIPSVFGNDLSWKVEGTNIGLTPIGIQTAGTIARKVYYQGYKPIERGEAWHTLFMAMPDFLSNPYKAFFAEGGTGIEGKPPIEYKGGEKAVKAFGFTPTRESESRQAQALAREKQQDRLEKLGSFAERYIVALKEKDSKKRAEEVKEISLDISEYNKRQISKGKEGLPITSKEIEGMVKRRKEAREKGYEERLPKYMRTFQMELGKTLRLEPKRLIDR